MPPLPSFRKFLPPALFCVAALTHLNAQTATTSPHGCLSLAIPATQSGQTRIHYLTFPLSSAPVYSTAVTEVTLTTLTVSGTPWLAGAFLAQPHFARIATGAQAGRTMLITANGTSILEMDVRDNTSQTVNLTAPGFSISPGDRIEIFQGATLASIFGDGSTQNPLSLTGASSVLTADTVSVYSPKTKTWETYYFRTSRSQWEKQGSMQNRNSTLVYPDSAVSVTRRPNRPETSVQNKGTVPLIAPLSKCTGGSSNPAYGGSRYPIDATLGTLSILGWVKNNSSLSADTLSIWNVTTGKWETFFQRSADSQWRLVGGGSHNQSAKVLAAGTGFSITKRSNLSGAASFVSSPIPYTP